MYPYLLPIPYMFLYIYLFGINSFSSLYLRVEKELKVSNSGNFSLIFNRIDRASVTEASLFDLKYDSYELHYVITNESDLPEFHQT